MLVLVTLTLVGHHQLSPMKLPMGNIIYSILVVFSITLEISLPTGTFWRDPTVPK